jgi:hypothetical protein
MRSHFSLFADLNQDSSFGNDEVIEDGGYSDEVAETLGAGTYFLNVYPSNDDDNSEYDLSFSRS